LNATNLPSPWGDVAAAEARPQLFAARGVSSEQPKYSLEAIPGGLP